MAGLDIEETDLDPNHDLQLPELYCSVAHCLMLDLWWLIEPRQAIHADHIRTIDSVILYFPRPELVVTPPSPVWRSADVISLGLRA